MLLQVCDAETQHTSTSPSQQQQEEQQPSMPQQCRRLVLTSVGPLQQQQQQQPPNQQPQQQQPAAAWIEVPPGVYSITAQALQQLLLTTHTSRNGVGSSCGVATQTPTPNTTTATGGGVELPSAHDTPGTGGCGVDGGGVPAVFLPAHKRPAAAGGGAGGAAVGVASGHAPPATSDAAANRGVLSPSELCVLLPGLQHHSWVDMQLLQLQQYPRLVCGVEAVPGDGGLAGGDGRQQQEHEAAAAIEQMQLQQPMQQQQPLPPPPQHQQQSPGTLEQASQQLLQVMQAAVDIRCLTINTLQQHAGTHQPPLHDHKQPQQQQEPAQPCPSRPTSLQLPPAPVLILFSGGVDSTLIAALAHNSLPPGVPIDLSNVCFDSGRSADRAAARAAVLELAAYAPQRQWRLIEVDSSLAQVDCLAQHIRALLQPAATVMDWNIGSALWLAAKAEGRVWVPVRRTTQQTQQQEEGCDSVAPALGWRLEPVDAAAGAAAASGADGSSSSLGAAASTGCCYRSAARVVLLGHGADEQCGGYGRHRTK